MRKMGQNRPSVADFLLFSMPFGCVVGALRTIGPAKILGKNCGSRSLGETILDRLGRPSFPAVLAHAGLREIDGNRDAGLLRAWSRVFTGLGRGGPARWNRVVAVGGHAVLLGHGDRRKLTITVIIHTSEFVSRGPAEFFCRPPGKCRPCAQNRLLTTACGGWLGPSTAAPPWGAYTKAAVIRQQQIQSPLDKLTGQSRPCPSPQQIGLPRSPAPVAQPVGRMQIRVRRRKVRPRWPTWNRASSPTTATSTWTGSSSASPPRLDYYR